MSSCKLPVCILDAVFDRLYTKIPSFSSNVISDVPSFASHLGVVAYEAR